MTIIIGLVMIALGAWMVIKSQQAFGIFGAMPWCEANLSGGSEQGYKLLGVIFTAIGILTATGLFGKILIALIMPLFGR